MWPYKSYCENALFLLKSSILLGIDLKNWVYSKDDVGSVYKNCKFHAPGGGGGGGEDKLCLIFMTCINIQYIYCYCSKGFIMQFSSAIFYF